MKRLLGLLLYLIIITLTVPALAGTRPGVRDSVAEDPMQFALLTCSPGDKIYELYGHTAIRYTNAQTGEDWVFNYGVFDFNTPHFVWRFLTAECDYELGVIPFYYFRREYAARGSVVYQQVLNLTPEEKQRLYQILAWNSLPENVRYRYNLLYDNCTTRARDRIEDAIVGKIVYAPADTVLSYRQIIHQFTVGHPWSQEGNDLCLGVEADRPVTQRQAMFAPFYYMRDVRKARIQASDGTVRPLLLSESEVVSVPSAPEIAADWLTPARAVALGLLVAFLLLVLEWRCRRMFWGVDVLLMLAQGVGGCIIAFLFFFSDHPTVGSNVQVMVWQPFPLIALFWVAVHAARRRFTRYHALRIVWLTLFMLVSFLIGQDISILTRGLAQILFLRSVSYILFYHRNQIRRNPSK